MRASAKIRSPDGRTVELGHGDLIGRLESAALHIPDPRVSEAHAMVSLRGTSLKLIALRGRLGLEGNRVTDIELAPGMAIDIARDLTLHVVEVSLPERVPALRFAGQQEHALTGVCSLYTAGGMPRVVAGFHPDAAAHAWVDDGAIVVRRQGVPDETLLPGDTLAIDDAMVEVVEMGLKAEGQYITTSRDAIASPLEIVARFESVWIYRKDEPALVLTGISARILSELVSMGVPVPWLTVAREVWPEEAVPEDLRVKWDVSVGRLRRKLQDARIRTDLVRPDGRGNIELRLERDDIVRDEA